MAFRKAVDRADSPLPTWLALSLGGTSLGTVLFWVSFALGDPETSFLARQCAAWYSWERSFIAADLWMAVAAGVGTLGLLRRRPWGFHWAGMAGSGLLFLALMDILFFLQNGLYRVWHPEVLLEALIHLWALALGIGAVAYSSQWAARRAGDHQR